VLVGDYLARFDAAAAALPVGRRVELTMQVREHIATSLAEAGRSDEVTVRNILERLGSPDEILAAETGQSVPRGGTAPASIGEVAGRGSRWGAVEVAAILLLGLAWPALFLPFGLALWLGLGAVGLALVWASSVWTSRSKLATTGILVAFYVVFFLVTASATVACTTGNPPVSCPAGGSQPIETSFP
jgi:hypothetical protein